MTVSQALALLQEGRTQEASRVLSAWTQEHPQDARAWFLLGACQHAQNQLDSAAASFSECSRLDPGNVEAHIARVTVLRAKGELPRAWEAARDAVRGIPGNARLHYAAALAADELGRIADALSGYARALQLEPAYEDALHNRGLLLLRAGLTAEAIANQRHAVRAAPESVRAGALLADALLAAGDFEEVMRVLASLPAMAQDDVGIQIRRGIALAGLRRYEDAHIAFGQANAMDADGVARFVARIAPQADLQYVLSPENLFLWQGWLALGRCDWSWWSAFVSEMRRIPSSPGVSVEPAAAFMAFHLPLSGPERRAVAGKIAADVESRAPVMPAAPPRRPGPIRLGILSPDLREHLNAYLLLPFFQLLNRSRFHLHAYSIGAEDRSDIRGLLAARAEKFVSLHMATDEQAANAIREDDVDILLDVGGHTSGARFGITARRPARVHCTYLGFPGSLGSTRVDFAFIDAVVGCDPQEWTEELISLPQTYYLYDFRDKRPAQGVRRADYGLREDAFVYCAFHKAEKISPDTFSLWTRVLRLVPSSVLWLLALPEPARRNLHREASAHGVDPSRLIFAPFEARERYLARHHLGQLFLDALHHSAMTTACDALAAGLPVLTLRGQAMSSRAGESLVRAAGIPELVCADREAFVSEAVALASDPTRLDEYRQRLLARGGPLFDTAGRVRELENALLEAWDRRCRSEAD